MRATAVDLVTPHLLRIVELANEAEKGVNVDWHVRDAVARTIAELEGHFNTATLLTTYAQGLENAASQAPKSRVAYIQILQAAAGAANRLGRIDPGQDR